MNRKAKKLKNKTKQEKKGKERELKEMKMKVTSYFLVRLWFFLTYQRIHILVKCSNATATTVSR